MRFPNESVGNPTAPTTRYHPGIVGVASEGEEAFQNPNGSYIPVDVQFKTVEVENAWFTPSLFAENAS